MEGSFGFQDRWGFDRGYHPRQIFDCRVLADGGGSCSRSCGPPLWCYCQRAYDHGSRESPTRQKPTALSIAETWTESGFVYMPLSAH